MTMELRIHSSYLSLISPMKSNFYSLLIIFGFFSKQILAVPTDQSFAFDALNRVTAAASNNYIYDTAGNLLQITGVVGSPEIVVEQPVGVDLEAGGSEVNFDGVPLGTGSPAVTVTIRNLGTADLIGLALTKSGSNAGDFAVSGPAITTLTPGGSTTFNVTFSPLAVGTRVALLHIASNDADENPFIIGLRGSGLANTVYSTTGSTSGRPLWNRPNHNGDLPPASLSSAATAVPYEVLSFTVDTSGDYAFLSTTTSPAGWDNYLFLYLAFSPSSPLVNGLIGNDDFPDVGVSGFSYGLTAGATYTLVTTGYSNSSSGAYSLKISGPGTVTPQGGSPFIVVEQPSGTPLTDGVSVVNLGGSIVGGSTTRSFVVRNSGSGNLTGLALNIDGDHPGDFTLSSMVPTLDPSASTGFTVMFSPGSLGARTAQLHLVSNDSARSPFDIALTGEGLTEQQGWRQLYFGFSGNTGNAADTYDFDKDGLANLLEYGFGSNPTVSSTAQIPQWQRSGGEMVVSFTQPAGVTGVTYSAEWSTSLVSTSWSGAGVVHYYNSGVGSHTFTVPAAGTRVFVRLKVTSP
mgnify:CR=1 FL=1